MVLQKYLELYGTFGTFCIHTHINTMLYESLGNSNVFVFNNIVDFVK